MITSIRLSLITLMGMGIGLVACWMSSALNEMNISYLN